MRPSSENEYFWIRSKLFKSLDRHLWPAKALFIKLIANHAILRMLANENAPGIQAGLKTSQGRAAVMAHS